VLGVDDEARGALRAHFTDARGKPIRTPHYTSQHQTLYEHEFFPSAGWSQGRRERLRPRASPKPQHYTTSDSHWRTCPDWSPTPTPTRRTQNPYSTGRGA